MTIAGCGIVGLRKAGAKGDRNVGTAELCLSGVPGQKAQDPPRGIPGADGALIPWERLEERIQPHYPNAGPGSQPYDLSVMLQVHIVQVCYNLNEPGTEDLLYETESVRRFVGLRLTDPLPDESTILHFRHLLERHNLGQRLSTEVKKYLAEQGVWLKEGTIRQPRSIT